MNMSLSYTQQYNEVVLEEAREALQIQGKYPFQNSEWKARFQVHMNIQENRGELLRSTFLSGGSLHMNHVLHWDSLIQKTRDIDAGCILTDAEVAHNSEGIRLFFELDYRTSDTLLPTWDEALLHLRVLYRTVQECYPTMEDLPMHVATCTRKRKQKRAPASIQLAWGIHVVFPSIVTTTSKMKLIAQLLDIRISNLFPSWGNIVDPASYRAQNATLRPCFSYKMIDCPICSLGPKPTIDKRRRPDALRDTDSLFRMQLSASCSCFSGRRLDASTYTYAGTLQRADGTLDTLFEDTHSVLCAMSITPRIMGSFTPGFARPFDMGDEHDRIPQSDILFTSERRVLNGVQRRKNTESVDPSRFPDGYQFLLQTIKRIDLAYQYLAIHKLSLDTTQRTFFITVKGSGSRYCMYRKGFHSSNRVYFILDLKHSRLHVHCFDPDCKRDRVARPVTRALSMIDRHRICTGFELSNTSERPTLSPIVGMEEIPPPPVELSKVSVWEAKQRAYRLLSTQ